ncbi:MAG: DUF2239 family protein [Deltaproteobacteria bacterium]|nr:DUF2239 family protein [Deltaproteobacteria bacterium]
MERQYSKNCTAFNESSLVASGTVLEVAKKVKGLMERKKDLSILIFDDNTAELVEVDFRGTQSDVQERLKVIFATEMSAAPDGASEPPQQQGPGYPRLCVVSREVTLLPRHWEWLKSQPGGASVALRKLVEEARKANSSKNRARKAQGASYRFMTTMAGNLPRYEEAIRALYAGNLSRFNDQISLWPADIKDYAMKDIRGRF